jgi:hypothetical protein
MGSKDWLPLYKKIQNAGKNLVIDSAPENISHLYKNLDPRGLYVRTFYRSEYIANQYLPKFAGGREGGIVLSVIDWLNEQGENKVTKEKLDSFLLFKNLEIENKYRKDLLKEIHNCFSGEWHD